MNADDPRHGTYNGYNNLGCRCDRCRRANREYCQRLELGNYAKDMCPDCDGGKNAQSTRCRACDRKSRAASHGTESGYTSGCRCDRCRAAATQARRNRRARVAA